jgi:hypothetical protein
MFFRTCFQQNRTPTAPFHFLSPIILSPTEVPVVEFNGVVRTTDFLGADQHMFQLDLFAECGPLSDVCRTELLPFVDSVSRYSSFGT